MKFSIIILYKLINRIDSTLMAVYKCIKTSEVRALKELCKLTPKLWNKGGLLSRI